MQKRRDNLTRERAEESLPLRPIAFAVLSSLARGPRAGFEILEFVQQTHPATGLLGPGTLYRLLRELRKDGLIQRTSAPGESGGSDDERRTYSALTAWGEAVMHAEAARLRRTFRAAGLPDLLGET